MFPLFRRRSKRTGDDDSCKKLVSGKGRSGMARVGFTTKITEITKGGLASRLKILAGLASLRAGLDADWWLVRGFLAKAQSRKGDGARQV